MATSPYTSQSAPATYNASPPADDGSQVAGNVTKWGDHVITLVGGPLKTFCENIDAALVTAFGKVINTDADENNIFAGSLAYTSSELTIATGSVTGTRAFHTVDTESDAASDDLDTLAVTNYAAGEIVYLQAAASARVVYVTTAGNFRHPCMLSATWPTPFMWDGTKWNIMLNGLILLDKQTASASDSLDFTKGIGSAYSHYMLRVSSLLPTTDADNFWIRLQDTTFQSDAADYEYSTAHQESGDAGIVSVSNSTGAAQIVAAAGVGNTAGEGVSGIIELFTPSVAASGANGVDYRLKFFSSAATPEFARAFGAGAYNGAANAVTGIQALFSSGAGGVASGSAELFGLRGFI